MPTLRMWCGQQPYKVTGRLIRDTGTGLIVEDDRGVRYFAPSRNVLADEKPADLFSPL